MHTQIWRSFAPEICLVTFTFHRRAPATSARDYSSILGHTILRLLLLLLSVDTGVVGGIVSIVVVIVAVVVVIVAVENHEPLTTYFADLFHQKKIRTETVDPRYHEADLWKGQHEGQGLHPIW